MSRRAKRAVKKRFNWYPVLIIICLAVIIGCIITLLEQDSKLIPVAVKEQYVNIKENIMDLIEGKNKTEVSNKETDDEKETNKNTNNSENKETKKPVPTANEQTGTNSSNNTKKEITAEQEKRAKQAAVEKFKELGEKDITEDKLIFIDIYITGEKYFYVDSRKNNLEIKIDTCEITKINDKEV